jgi:sensor histidine kinase YesM
MAGQKSISRHLRESVYILIGSGLFFGILYALNNNSLSNVLLAASFNAAMWVMMWKGNELIVSVLDKRISWLETPGKRLGIGILFMLLYVSLAAIFINFIFYLFLADNWDFSGIYESILQSTVVSVVITFFIMLSIYSYSFLKSWRQAAINIEKLKKESIASQYEILKNQVNPHFLFNTLNALTSLIYEDREKAVTFINRFSEVYRYVLDSKDREVVSVKSEMEFAKSFIFLLQTRYEKNFVVSFKGNVPEGYMPPMALQMVVENAVKHNVISDENPLNMDIDISVDEIMVRNNITQPRNTNSTTGLGLDNIRSRYELLSNRSFSVSREDDHFIVRLPVLQMMHS